MGYHASMKCIFDLDRGILLSKVPYTVAATLGEQSFGCYIGMAFIEGLFCTQTVGLGPGFLAEVAFIQGWPLGGVPL